MATFSVREQLKQVRHLFPQLLKNGYVPLPNRDKACMLPKWSTIEVDEQQCQRWVRQLKWPAIGLRVEPPLLVLDYDIPDRDILNALEDITPSVVFDGLERIGNAPKTAFFMRMSDSDEPFHEAHTRRYHVPGMPKPAFAVQAFAGGGGGRQFGAFGPHSHDPITGMVLKTYSWFGGRSPATVPIDELPELTRAQVFDLLDEADAMLAGWPGLVVDTLTKHGMGSQAQVHDLTEDMVFHDVEGVEYSYEELCDEAKARKELGQPVIRITGSFTNDPTSSGSPRAKVYWSPRNGLSIVDFKTDTTHRPLLNTEEPEMQQLLNEIFTKRTVR
jgi:hypothetical protein